MSEEIEAFKTNVVCEEGDHPGRLWIDEQLATVDATWSEILHFDGPLGLEGLGKLIPQPSHIAWACLRMSLTSGELRPLTILDQLSSWFPLIITGFRPSEMVGYPMAGLSRMAMVRRCEGDDRVVLAKLERDSYRALETILKAIVCESIPSSTALQWSHVFCKNDKFVVLWRTKKNTVLRLGD